MFKGSFSAFLFFSIGAIFAILSLVIIYWQSQYYHQEPPFPQAFISKVAQHYPEFLVFRLSTITGASLIILGWFTNHFVLQTVCREQGINIRKYHAWIPLLIGSMGGMFLMGNTASIDTGYMNGKLHGFCASKFFILTIVAQVYNTVIVADLCKRTTSVSKFNLYLKYFVLFMLAVQAIDTAVKGYGPFRTEGEENNNKDIFLEWTLTATVISMFVSIGLDARKFEFVFTDVEQRSGEWEGRTMLREAMQ
jgi:hypothetical protein